ncbi:MAG: hypothetical protein GX797_01000 [Chloroflexi bacterium]|nr:hypothetical protein [Chloroflexota bacterium]
MPDLNILLTLAGIVLSLMVFSYLLGDNLFFGIAMYILVGVSAGYAALILINRVIIPMLIMPLTSLPQLPAVLAFVPAILSILLLWNLFRKTSKLAGIPLGFLVGILAAVSVAGISRGTLAPQLLGVVNAFDPQVVVRDGQPNWNAIFEAFMMLLGVIAVLLFFHHRKKGKNVVQSPEPWVDGFSGVGQVFIGITFGAIFAGLFGTALTALIGSINRIINFVRLWL